MEFQEQAWLDYVEQGRESDATRMLYLPIWNSWQRCKARKQDIHNSQVNQVPQDELERRITAMRRLILVAFPFLEELYTFVQGTGFMVALLDKDACMLEVMGDPELLESFWQFRPGEIWDEETKGTNAMGVAKVERQPVQVHASEHYVRSNHGITCSAAPIFDENGEVAAILDMTGHCQHTHMHTLGMVVAAVKAIENEMSLRTAATKLSRSYDKMATILDTITDGIVSFDNQGVITQTNQIALRILNQENMDCVGKKLKTIFNSESVTSDILFYGRNIYDREFIQDINGQPSRFLLSGSPIIDQMKEICGGVVVLRETKHVHKMITKVVGARARFTFNDITGESPAIKNCIQTAKSVASSKSSILIYGESGTGKEMFAQAIHNKSGYANGPFVAINCGAIPRDLVESELFGYMEGTFTGARKGGQAGKFELANDGTIFFDEIANMPPEIQVVLLRVLQENQVVRIGGYNPIPINVRVMAATNRDLWQEVQAGNFRHDLYYRLNVINILVPPLREREGDVTYLARYFLEHFSSLLNYPVAEFEPEVVEALERYSWPGNIRELANAIERVVNLAQGGRIRLSYFPEQITQCLLPSFNPSAGADPLSSMERDAIIKTLESVGWNVSRAAAILGIARNTLYRKIDKYHIIVNK